MIVDVVLEGGPCDGLRFRTNDQDVLLMPTDRRAVFGHIPPTAPEFAEYRRSVTDPVVGLRREETFVFVGIGISVEAEEVIEPKALNQ